MFALIVVVALGLAFEGGALAQTTSKNDVHKFEVVSVNGNRLVVRDERGTNAYTVPDDFRLTVDGRKMSVSELRPGMKGTATVTTTTTSKPGFVTEVRQGVVLEAGPGSITIRNADGDRKRFTRDDIDRQGMQIVKDGKAIRIDEAQKGDMITATIISKAEPVVVAKKEVQVTTTPAQAKAESPPVQMAKADATPPPAEPAIAPAQPAAAEPAVAPPAVAQPAVAEPAPATSERAGLGMMWWLVIAALIAAVVFAVVRRRKVA